MNRKPGVFAGAAMLLQPGILDEMKLAWRLLRDQRVTSLKYLAPALLALYVASPIDAIPDLLIGVGQIDDLGVAVLGLMVALKVIPKLASADVLREHMTDLQGGAPNAQPGPSRVDPVVDAHYTVRS
ncbi:MAG: DUF1232 domain-containing protein [Thermomicrobiales bacterium]|nr:DUF1232 domain-containing protein [Thermomicrobiales bacterium]